MFPPLRVRVSGLEPNGLYSIFLELALADDRRYRFAHETGQWHLSKAMSGGAAAAPPLGAGAGAVGHPLSPAPGHLWASQGVVSFDRIKLTNTKHAVLRDHVPLLSMYRYVAKIHVMLSNPTASEIGVLNLEEAVTFTFPVTTFIAVTAYQNREITKLKCACNPFATGVRLSKGLTNIQVPNNAESCSPSQEQFQQMAEKRMEPTLKDETNHAFTGLQDKQTDMRLKDKYIRQKPFTAEPNDHFNPFDLKTSQKNYSYVSYYDRSKSGVLEDFRLMYPKVPIKFVIPPLYKNVMLNWPAEDKTEIKPLI